MGVVGFVRIRFEMVIIAIYYWWKSTGFTRRQVVHLIYVVAPFSDLSVSILLLA